MSRSGTKSQGQMSGERIAGIWKSGAGKERRKEFRRVWREGYGRALLVKGVEIKKGQKPGG